MIVYTAYKVKCFGRKMISRKHFYIKGKFEKHTKRGMDA